MDKVYHALVMSCIQVDQYICYRNSSSSYLQRQDVNGHIDMHMKILMDADTDRNKYGCFINEHFFIRMFKSIVTMHYTNYKRFFKIFHGKIRSEFLVELKGKSAHFSFPCTT
jgi:hypothetical protein